MSGEGPSKMGALVRQAIAGDDVGKTVQADPANALPVYVRAEPGRAGDARRAIEDLGVGVRSESAGYIAADVPPGRVAGMVQSSAVRHVMLRWAPRPHSVPEKNISEGVGVSNADTLHGDGITGTGSRIAIIDHVFHTDNPKYSDEIVATIGPTGAFTSSADYTGGTQHGTACAEIVADMAPDAELVLASTTGSQSFSQLMSSVESHNPDAATMSLGYQTSLRIDGQDPISTRVDQFTNGSRLFAVSAGNGADGGHWDGSFQDDGSGLMVFHPDLSTPTRYPVLMDPLTFAAEVHVHWDADWSQDNQRYEARLYDSETATSPIVTTQTTDPVEVVSLTPSQHSASGPTNYYLEIENVGATGSEHFDMFVWGRAALNGPTTAPRSLAIPATSPDTDTLSVGAVQATPTGFTMEEHLKPYSSRGPTQDGRRGLDIAAPSRVSQTDVGAHGGYGSLDDYTSLNPTGFNGTSAASPHVGGALGLLFGNRVDATAGEARQALFDTGVEIADGDVSAPGSNNEKIGFGYIEVADASAEIFAPEPPLSTRWTSAGLGGRAQNNRPAVDPQRVYAGGLQNTFYALSRSDGTVVEWSFDRGTAAGLSDSSGALSNGTVYVGSGQGTFFALNTSDGSTAWSVTLDSAITSSPAVANGTVYAGTNDGTVYAWAADTGSQTWSGSVGGAVLSRVAADGNRVYVTTNAGDLVVLDAASGTEQWRATLSAFGSSSPALGNGSVFVAGNEVHAYDAASTKSKSWTSSGFGGTAGSSPTHHDGTVYVGSEDGNVYAFDASSGSEVWSFSTGGPVAATPAVSASGTRVLAASTDGTLSMLDGSGSQLDSVSIPTDTRGQPVVDEGAIFLGTRDGTVHAFE